MVTKYNLESIKSAVRFNSFIEVEQVGNRFTIKYVCDGNEVSADDIYPFFALVKVRVELENLGIKILCKGARRDVYPSGMSVIGFKAYQLFLGKPGIDLINIFDHEKNEMLIGTVEEQRLFREKWLKSLKKNRL
jgi:hypothetical protein